MKFAIYYPWVYLPGGPERLFVEILDRSRHEWVIYTSHFDRDATFPQLRNANIVEVDRVSVKRDLFTVAMAGLRTLNLKLPVNDCQGLLIVCEGLGDFTLRRTDGIPAACLCLTPLRIAFDDYYRQHYFINSKGRYWRKPALNLALAIFRRIDRWLWRRYQKVFAISSVVRDRIITGNLYPADEIQILYPGIDVAKFSPSNERQKDFVVAGRIMWTKNIELAIESFKLFKQNRPDLSDFTLTIAGHVDRKSEKYLDKLKNLATNDPQIRFRRKLSDAELFDIISKSYAVLFTAFNEDWGLVPLEAMALQRPVIAVNRGGPKESIAHGESGFLSEPDAGSFASYMEKLADSEELTEQLGRQARKQAELFNLSEFVKTLDDEMEELATRPNTP